MFLVRLVYASKIVPKGIYDCSVNLSLPLRLNQQGNKFKSDYLAMAIKLEKDMSLDFLHMK